MAESLEVEGQRVGRNAHALGDIAGGYPFRPCLHQQPIDLQAAVLRQGTQGCNGGI